jgi:hypothetical protein
MKYLGIAILLLGLTLVGCGGGNSSNSNNVSGNWTAAGLERSTRVRVHDFSCPE